MEFKRLLKALMLTIIIIVVLIMIVMISAALTAMLPPVSPDTGRLIFLIAIFMLFVGICYNCFC